MSDASITPTAAARTSPAFQPYGFLLTGGRRQSVHSSSGGLGTPTGAGSHPTSGFPTPATSPADFTVGGSLLSETEHAKALSADLDFIVPPMITPVLDTTQATSPRCLFLGHLRFETTTAEVRWMIKKLCDVDPLRADIRGNGCCVVHLATDKDVVAVRALNRRVLFDHHGFWFARTADAVDRLLDYVESDMPKKKKNMHLPRDALVVEDSRSSKAGHRRHPQQPLQPTSASASSLASKRQHLAPSLDATMSGTMRSAVPTPCKSPMSPCALGSPAYRNFHDSPPDYVHPPSQQMSCRTSPSSHPAMPPPPPPYHALLDSCSSTDVSLTSF